MTRWPVGIALSLTLVVLVNAAVWWIAVMHADPVVDSYVTEHR
jgi:hypothetical protein